MAKIVYLCLRNFETLEGFPEKIFALNHRIIPDNITPNPPRIFSKNGVMVGVLNPTSELLIEGGSICLGFPVFVPPDWHEPGGKDPDGSYALFRSDDNFVELATDVVSSRTIWYCQTDEFFIASSSQRAIVAFLGDFQLNELVFPNLLANGILGPKNSWDERIQYLECDEHLLLDRKMWLITRKQVNFELNPTTGTREEFIERLTIAFKGIFSDIVFDPAKWPLALSGGVDSRAILAFLKQKDIQCVTWGPKASLSTPGTDPNIAQKVAASMNAQFQFFEIDRPVEESGEAILQRFIKAAEGRVDHLGAYRDGFITWKTLFEDGYHGIIRGDEFVGLERPVTTERKVFTDRNFNLLDDYANLPPFQELGIKEQILPPEYARGPDENITAWAYRIDYVMHKAVEMAALNEIKTCYLEVMNPLLSRRVIKIIQTIPYQINPNKRIFREIVRRISPQIEYAGLNTSMEDILREPIFREAILDCLKSSEAKKWLSERLISLILDRLSKPDQAVKRSIWEPIIEAAKKVFPKITVLSKFIRRNIYLDDYLFAFRAYIIIKSCQLFSEDATFFKEMEKKPSSNFSG
jgi:hypothetical protein